MTRISTIHGIGADEYAGRAAMVKPAGYVPYLSLTRGEMELYLAAQRAKVRAEWYGNDDPRYRQAFQMLENALHQGVNNVKFIGAVPNYLQDVARLINKAKRETAPASRAIYFQQIGVSGIGQTIIPVEDRKNACVQQAMKLKKPGDRIKAIKKCEDQFAIEKLYNDKIKSVGHHMLYYNLPENIMSLPPAVSTKRILQLGGVQGMAIAASLDNGLMASWVETGIVLKNGTLPAVGPRNSINTSFQLAPDPAYWMNTYEKKKKTGGYGITGINCGPVCLALLPVIVAALTAAVEITKSVVIQAQGFGTDALKSTQFDWKDMPPPGDSAGGFSTNTILLLGGAAALFLLADNK